MRDNMNQKIFEKYGVSGLEMFHYKRGRTDSWQGGPDA
jgi:hypothetical protein